MSTPISPQKVTEADKISLREWAVAYMDTTGISQKSFGKEINYGNSTVSNFYNGKELEKLADEFWISVRKARVRLTNNGWVAIEDTEGFLTIKRACNYCRRHNALAVVDGGTGFGKSFALRHFLRRNLVETFYTQCVANDTKDDFVNTLCDLVGAEVVGSAGRRLKAIAARLNTMSSPLLILDEAGSLSDDKLVILKDLWNYTEGTCGIVLVGVGYVYSKLYEGARREKNGLPEFLSRVRYRRSLPAPTRDELSRVAMAQGITDPAILDVLLLNCKDFRTLQSWVNMAAELGQGITPGELYFNMTGKEEKR